MKKIIIFLAILLSFTNVYAKPVTDYSSQSGADVSSSDLFLTIDVSEANPADQTKKINSYDLGIGLSEHIVGKNIIPIGRYSGDLNAAVAALDVAGNAGESFTIVIDQAATMGADVDLSSLSNVNAITIIFLDRPDAVLALDNDDDLTIDTGPAEYDFSHFSVSGTASITFNYSVTARVKTYAQLTAAIAAAPDTILVTAPITLTANVEVPSGTALTCLPSAVITTDATHTLTFASGSKFAPGGLFQHFSGAGVTGLDTNCVEAVYPQYFGAVPDGTTDYTAEIQAAVDAAGEGGAVVISGGTFMVDSQADAVYFTYGGISLLSNQTLSFVGSGKLMSIPTDGEDASSVIIVQGQHDVTILDPQIVGDRDAHTGDFGEWGHGISVWHSNNINIFGGYITKCVGDGIYVDSYASIVDGLDDGTLSTNIKISAVTIDNCRRQGISIIAGDGVSIDSCMISNIDGTSPKSCIDLEPRTSIRSNANISITNNTLNNSSESKLGRGIAVLRTTEANTNTNVLIDGNIINADIPISVAATSDVLITNNTITTTADTNYSGALYLVDTGGSREGKGFQFIGNKCKISGGGTLIYGAGAWSNKQIGIIKNNTFQLSDTMYTTFLPGMPHGEFIGNTIIIPSTFTEVLLGAASTLIRFLADGWIFDSNTIINNSAIPLLVTVTNPYTTKVPPSKNVYKGPVSPLCQNTKTATVTGTGAYVTFCSWTIRANTLNDGGTIRIIAEGTSISTTQTNRMVGLAINGTFVNPANGMAGGVFQNDEEWSTKIFITRIGPSRQLVEWIGANDSTILSGSKIMTIDDTSDITLQVQGYVAAGGAAEALTLVSFLIDRF